VAQHPERRNTHAFEEHTAVAVEKGDVEREAHPERVDAAAGGEQQPRPGRSAVEQREAQEAGAERRRDGIGDAPERAAR
jgi:hypothetical protein